MPSKNQPVAAWREYPEPEFPNGRARDAYRKALAKIIAAGRKRWDKLDLRAMGLTALPPEIGQLTALTRLDLSNNRLTTVPPEIGQLTALMALYLHDNELTALPPEIGQLSSLTELYLNNNQLRALPPEIGQLSALRQLYLWGNFLQVLPPKLGLTLLEDVILDGNQLTALPDALQSCHELVRLSLIRNRLGQLPEWLLRLPKLTHLRLHENSRLGIPDEILGPEPQNYLWGGPTAQAILDFYFARKAGDRPLNEVKLLLIGRGGVGKTATMNRLLGRGFEPGTEETLGIEITDFDLPCAGGEPVRVHGWDFAGQTVTHGLHKFFLSHRSVYLLVLSGREGTAQEDAEYWLKLMEAYAKGEEDGKREMPPVVVLLNKWEQGETRAQVDREGLEEKYPWIAGWVETDAKTGLGYEHGKVLLPELLKELVAKMEWVRAPFPAAWHKAKEHFSRMKQETGRDYLPYTAFQKQAVELGVKEETVGSLSVVLHRLGIALNYGERLADTTVLNPHWVTGTIYKVLRRAPRESDAVMTLEHVAEVLPEEPAEMRAYVVELMRRFDLAFPLPDKEGHWLVPARLPEAQPPGVKEEFGPEVAGATRLRFTVNPLPRMILPSFVTRTHILSDDLAKVRWANGAVLELNKAKALVKADHADRTVMVTLVGEVKDRPTLASLCRRELAELFREIPGLEPREELQVGVNDWVNVPLLEAMEQQRLSHAHMLINGQVTFLPILQTLNSIAPHQLRQDGIKKPSVFISYSHRDEKFKDELVMRLKVLQAAGLAGTVWTDRMLEPGELWDTAIIQNLKKADVVVLLLSNAAMASPYIQKKEVATALERHRAGTAVVVPVILERCQWNLGELKALQALPRDAKPLREWKPQNAGWYNVMEALKEKIAAMQQARE